MALRFTRMETSVDPSLETMEFTYSWYERFIRELRSAGYDDRTFGDDLGEGDVLLRHDVDLSLESAIRMARLEADMGVRATYFVLLSSPLYNPLTGTARDRVREIESLGHDVALHFSTHEYWDGSRVPTTDALEARVREEREVLDTVADRTAEAVSFHIPPQWVLDRAFDGLRSAYAPEYFSDAGYIADSGQRWREDRPRIADLPETVQVLTHPGLWGDEDGTFERRVDQHIVSSCSTTSRRARAEFVDGVNG
jgi:hypothetical protein